ncbi:MAG: hypothetical protein KAG62_05405 [Caulobacter sp.]|jgi:hypothetical protein|nr:hypothetical protein [Caulobacter sp.]
MQDWSSKGLLIAWTLVGVILYAVAPNLPFLLAIMIGPFLLAAVLAHIGFGLFLVGLFVVRHGDDWRKQGLLILSPILAFGALFVLSSASSHIVSWFAFMAKRPAYEAVIVSLERGVAPPQTPGLRYVAEGRTLRVAFPEDGIADNWSGVVYDPTDQVRAARGWKRGKPGRYTAPPRIQKWFGGDLVACSHLAGHFYRCGFT